VLHKSVYEYHRQAAVRPVLMATLQSNGNGKQIKSAVVWVFSNGLSPTRSANYSLVFCISPKTDKKQKQTN